jgi:Na+/proline symporter/nitrogen-specific signal transduction histidine kinase
VIFSSENLLLITAAYLVVLFLVAYVAERRQRQGRSLVANPWVYSLSLAVYCTSWTFYGSVGKAATSGLSFLTIYLGPTLMAVLLWVVMARVIEIAREQRITGIADFIGSRYGNSMALSALVTVVVGVGIVPYLGLQMKAIVSTMTLLTGRAQGSVAAGWIITAILALFAVVFGVRRPGASDKHEGLVLAIAFESIVKLVAFLAVGVYVTFFLFSGPNEIFTRIMDAQGEYLMRLGPRGGTGYSEWAALTFLSMMAIVFLPRQFHVMVVENHDVRHLRTAMWLFPLYLLLINLFVMPVAFGGLLLGSSAGSPDFFVLTIPMSQGREALALLVFLGGFSAATGMIIVESMAISTMVMNNLVNPAMYRFNRLGAFSMVLSNIKRLVIIGLVVTGYLFGVAIGDVYSLVDMGLKSFEAVSILAPAFFFGLYWKRGTAWGAASGIFAGFVIWTYTLLVPALVKAGVIARSETLSTLFASEWLNPHALFGLQGLDRWSHSLFWGLFFNVSLYVGVSLVGRQKEDEKRQALLFVDSYAPRVLSAKSTVGDIEELLLQYLGHEETRSVVDGFLARRGLVHDRVPHTDLLILKDEARRALSGALGATVAGILLEERFGQTEQERSELVSSIEQIGRTLMLSRQELARANRELGLLKEFSENIIESLPLGVATLDEMLRVRSWNSAMEHITGIGWDHALGMVAEDAFHCLSPGIFAEDGTALCEGDVTCKTSSRELMGHLTRLAGGEAGYVVVLEDVTEKKKIERELFLATKHASVGRLAAGVSHEIGNPLASISSLLQELMHAGAGGDAGAGMDKGFARDSLGTMLGHVNRIARIVRSLGDFARMYPKHRGPGSLVEALEKTLDLVRYDSNFRHIEIRTDLQPLPEVDMDADQIQQVFLNLILNARDAMPEGGTLSISGRAEDGSVVMEFADTGAGVPQGIRDQVFDPFILQHQGLVQGHGPRPERELQYNR